MLQAVCGGHHPFPKDTHVKLQFTFPFWDSPWLSVRLKWSPIPSPLAHCKESAVLLVVSLFLVDFCDSCDASVVGVASGVKWNRDTKKTENLWNSREELTGKNLMVLGIEPETLQTEIKNLNN